MESEMESSMDVKEAVLKANECISIIFARES